MPEQEQIVRGEYTITGVDDDLVDQIQLIYEAFRDKGHEQNLGILTQTYCMIKELRSIKRQIGAIPHE